MKQNKSASLTQEIQRITQDYEKLAKEQKERILALREENRALSEKLENCLKEKGAIATALVRAEQTGQQLIGQAKKRSEQILSEAYKKEDASRRRIEEHRALLRTLAVQCENILTSIENELGHPAGGFSLEVINKKQA